MYLSPEWLWGPAAGVLLLLILANKHCFLAEAQDTDNSPASCLWLRDSDSALRLLFPPAMSNSVFI